MIHENSNIKWVDTSHGIDRSGPVKALWSAYLKYSTIEGPASSDYISSEVIMFEKNNISIKVADGMGWSDLILLEKRVYRDPEVVFLVIDGKKFYFTPHSSIQTFNSVKKRRLFHSQIVYEAEMKMANEISIVDEKGLYQTYFMNTDLEKRDQPYIVPSECRHMTLKGDHAFYFVNTLSRTFNMNGIQV